MKVLVSSEAERDLADGFWFYDAQAPGLGQYFLDSAYSDM